MKTKTVHLNEFFSVINGVVCEYIQPSEWNPVFKVGDEVVLVIVNGWDDRDRYEIRIAPNGIGGNMDRSVKRFHGWRGTTNNISVTAMGRREIKKIRTLKNGTVAVTVGPDLDPDEA